MTTAELTTECDLCGAEHRESMCHQPYAGWVSDGEADALGWTQRRVKRKGLLDLCPKCAEKERAK